MRKVKEEMKKDNGEFGEEMNQGWTKIIETIKKMKVMLFVHLVCV